MNALDALVRHSLGAGLDRVLPLFALVCLRTLPLAFVAPWLGWKGTATYARACVAIVIALALTPLALSSAPELPASWLALALLGVREALIGTAFAVASSIPLWALGWAGELMDRWRGNPGSSVTGPSGPSSPLGVLHLSAAVVVFVLVGGHRLALRALGGSLVDAPIGGGASASDLAEFALGVGRIVTMSLELAVAFAAPAAIAFLVLEVVLGLAARVGLRLEASAPPLRAGLGIAVALIGLAAILPRLAPIFARSIETAADLVGSLGR